jgi:phospholipid/cholesterol/gamma-HCH transport system substrate-binding protein
MNKIKLDVWVGILVAIGIVALFGLATKVGNLTSNNIKNTYSINAYFENIGGLKPRAPVKSAGVVVGRVQSIIFDTEAYHAVVNINIDGRYVFPKDTFANIYTAGLLGEQYIALEAGGDLENLAPGDRIIQTQDAVVLEKLISQFLYNSASEGGK